MCPRRLHTLKPLTKIAFKKNKRFKWTKLEQDAFDENNRLIACNTLLTYTDFNETFNIYTNASKFQLGAVIIQKGKLIA